jgi:POT family proton-dependent oligopeptide transporter
MNFFAREHTTPMFGSMDTWQAGGFGVFQSANPMFILLFAPVFAALWPKLEKRGLNPSIPRKFSFALVQVALGFLLLVFAINNFQNAAGLVPWIFLGLIAAVASGGGGHGTAEGAGIAQYADTYMMLFWLGIGFAAVYFVAAGSINKLMHGVK